MISFELILIPILLSPPEKNQTMPETAKPKEPSHGLQQEEAVETSQVTSSEPADVVFEDRLGEPTAEG